VWEKIERESLLDIIYQEYLLIDCCLVLSQEIEHLHWQLNKMENSRKLYELATSQLVTFLEQVSASLASTSLRGSRANDLHRVLSRESLSSPVGALSRESLASPGGVLSRESLLEARELGLATLHMARSQSMPGLALAAAAAGTLPSLARRNLRLSSRYRNYLFTENI
jgi:hypothetical protein